MKSNKYTPQERYSKKNGLVNKSYKLQKKIVDGFAEACEAAGVSLKSQLEKMMTDFIEEVKSRE